MSILKEFREFAIKGNFVDLAVGVIIGAASGKVVNALVEKVIMPPIGLATGKVNFNELRVTLQPAQLGPDGKELVKEVAVNYGAALQSFFELLIVASVVFVIVRFYNRFRTAAPPPGPTAQEKLLAEIRDLLAAQARPKPKT
ncbi:MAG: large-conductance mechanosensitive channel protein MscL [Labilithrix sp.]|nr:large-conductance mechanosensitive channel protein MscL [Labilithrix sp.]MBX3212746.1 large-conductance mechanosensitive channel protein MscL [Labilithrix sp.]MBX3252393.1 large-conductance mechanosensitive channel protein MscL [Myxococcales bacterium]